MKRLLLRAPDPRALLLCVVAGCASAPPPPPFEAEPAPEPAPAVPVTRELTEDEIGAVAELLALEDRREADLIVFERHGAHPSEEVRRRAVLAAGRVGNRLATPFLLGALHDPAPAVAAAAAFALGELGDSAGHVIAALDSVLASAGSERDPRAIEAAGALGKLPTSASFAALQRLLSRGRSVAGASRTADRAAGALTGEALLAIWLSPLARNALDEIVPYARDANVEVRWRAVYALVRTAAPAAIPALLEAIDDGDPLVRSLAARGLRAPTADSAGQRSAAHVALTNALGDEHPHVRINALGSLATYDRERTHVAAMLTLLDDPDANVRLAAVQTLASASGTPGLATRVRTVAEDGGEPIGVRAAALTTLARLDVEQAVQEATRWAASNAWLHRWLALRAVGSAPWSHVEPLLRDLADDADERVALAALGAVRRLADTTAVAYALYVQTLTAPNPRVRAAAIAGIGRHGNPADLTALMDAYDSAQRDSADDAALAAVDALAALARSGVPVEPSFFLRFRPHPEATVRRRVAQRFDIAEQRAWADTARTVEVRSPAFYVQIVRDYIGPVLAGRGRPHVEIETPHGDIVIELAAEEAPLTVHNMVTLIESGFYDVQGDAAARRWHRVVPNFVLQDGDPEGTGSGGPDQRIRDEINPFRYLRGAVGMALSGPDTGGSQFFITHSPQPHLDGGYTIFGHVVRGMDAADRVVQDDLIPAMRVVWP